MQYKLSCNGYMIEKNNLKVPCYPVVCQHKKSCILLRKKLVPTLTVIDANAKFLIMKKNELHPYNFLRATLY